MIHQTAHEGNSLYMELEDGSRIFSGEVYRPDSSPAWPECTSEERAQWESAHQKERGNSISEE